ncbi:Thiamine pyrophosphate enzyme, N-terminal TPP-binding domain protein [Metarhizium rileyi]|uniref:Thiamine pyrophosphate enzyme, N-terminal TPP-binding domain protein n=1 Tax=Metarhizium rileyi (strain RCEF 4871) TaxID=1649241 RepID=A0A167AVG1_METRR|nr:Thiamine pyrophosphate enzyme, N-terminal TPP-binding domain protein [Metarhizium rileyi RCEF 4871]
MPPFDPKRFDHVALLPNGIDTAFGVPDTNLSGLLTYFSATKPVKNHIVTANEGAAVALAAGYHLSTGHVAMVYMQNSGLANALNPLQSIAAKEVFGIPMLLFIGWRGASAEEEELQDALVGPRLLGNLQANDIPHEEIPTCIHRAKEAISRLVAKAVRDKTPVALIAPRDTFQEYEIDKLPKFPFDFTASHLGMKEWISADPEHLPLSREGAIRCVIDQMARGDVSLSSLGGNSREYYMIRKKMRRSIARNFFCIGAMGHVYALSYGVSIGFTSGRIFCIDGEGSFLMHAGNIALLAGISPPNLIHIVIYNGVYASTGNHPVAMSRENLVSLARGLPYEQKFFVDDLESLEKACRASRKSTLIIVAVNSSAQKNLPAPSETPRELKGLFMKSLL